MSKFDVSTEFEVAPYKNGIIFLQPSKKSLPGQKYFRLEEVKTLPCNTYLLSKKSECLDANERMLESIDLSSIKDVLGKTVLEYSDAEQSRLIIENDIKVLCSEMPFFVDEVRYVKNVIHSQFLSIKIPAYNNNQELCGIIGFSVRLGTQPLAESLSLLTRMGLVNLSELTKKKFSPQEFYNVNGVNFTNRQAQVIALIVRGLSACQVAEKLGLSRRTVEHYIETIKIRLQVDSKADLIQKVINDGYFG